jgi:hypothetical protein
VGQLATIAVVFVFIWAESVYSQRYEITNRPDNHVTPAHCVCSRDRTSGEVTFEFFSEGARAAVLSSERRDTLTIKLFPHRKDQESQITFASGEQTPVVCPPGIGIVQIVLCRDTALIATNESGATLYRKSPQLIIDPAHDIPGDIVLVQTHSRQTGASHALIAAAVRRFPGALEAHVLEPGIYPSLEFPVVRVANIGRRQKVNETIGGYLVVFRVLDARRSDDISAWLDLQKNGL